MKIRTVVTCLYMYVDPFKTLSNFKINRHEQFYFKDFRF